MTTTLGHPIGGIGSTHAPMGTPLKRLDGVAKVTGAARYAAEHPAQGLVFGVVVSSAIAKGVIDGFEMGDALAVPGVLDVLTHEHRPGIRGSGLFYKDMTAPGGRPFRPLYDAHVAYSGQPVALVLAETFEAARYAASLVRVNYVHEAYDTDFMSNLRHAREPRGFKVGYSPPPKERGNARAALEAAPVRITADFHSGVEHHNPMEMHASTVLYGDDGHLTIHDKTQGSQNSRWVVSRVFGLPRSRVTVRNEFVGGAFGSGLRPQYQLLLAVMGALHLKRSVRVVLTRQQMFTFGHRPETWQRVSLAAEHDGKLLAVHHEAIAETSRMEDYVEVVVNWSGQLYQCENVKLEYGLVPLDVPTPMDMRAPGAAHGVHALEVAMDELAHALRMDPLALRLKNYAERDASKDLPFSSKELRACYAQGAERFGWYKRPLAPRSMKDGDELVGWGMATGTWDALQMFARAKAVLRQDGTLTVSSAASDIGTGTRTVMTQIAADAMGLPIEQVVFEYGDSTLPVAPIEGGSAHVATVGSAVWGVCEKLRRKLFKLARGLPGSPLAKARFNDLRFEGGRVSVTSVPGAALRITDILASAHVPALEEKYLMLPNALRQKKYVRAVHSAVFAEVKVDEELGTVRVTRVVSAIAAGRIINPKTATSQIVGGIVWGISQALHEETMTDHRLGRFMNHNLAEYHVPVNADIHDIDVSFVDEHDDVVSNIGAKGVGEIGIVGVAAAISNAIFHATGRRLTMTPMTPDKLMRPA